MQAKKIFIYSKKTVILKLNKFWCLKLEKKYTHGCASILKRYELHAVYNEDLDFFLKNLGILKALENGELSCFSCGSTVTKENFGCVLPEDDEIKICCDSLECFDKALERAGSKG